MRWSAGLLSRFGCVLALFAGAPAHADDSRGARLFAVAGCANCHSDRAGHGAPLAGGRALRTSWGIFYTPNISPDPVFGIGKWRAADFLRALREGIGPTGQPYYPAFPYTSYTGMTDADLLSIRDYLMAQPAQAVPDHPHELRFPFKYRGGIWLWRLLYFREGPESADPDHSADWNRGAYLVRAVAHCGECHTPRNGLGATMEEHRFAGSINGPDGMTAPDITPDPAALGKWSIDDIASFLDDGMTPSGDFTGGAMAEIVRGTATLSVADRGAIALYLSSQPPLPPTVPAPSAPVSSTESHAP